MKLDIDLNHLEKRANEVLKAAPEMSRLGKPDVREWWCDMLIRCIAEIRDLRAALAASNKIVLEQDLKLKADARALVALRSDLERNRT